MSVDGAGRRGRRALGGLQAAAIPGGGGGGGATVLVARSPAEAKAFLGRGGLALGPRVLARPGGALRPAGAGGPAAARQPPPPWQPAAGRQGGRPPKSPPQARKAPGLPGPGLPRSPPAAAAGSEQRTKRKAMDIDCDGAGAEDDDDDSVLTDAEAGDGTLPPAAGGPKRPRHGQGWSPGQARVQRGALLRMAAERRFLKGLDLRARELLERGPEGGDAGPPNHFSEEEEGEGWCVGQPPPASAAATAAEVWAEALAQPRPEAPFKAAQEHRYKRVAGEVDRLKRSMERHDSAVATKFSKLAGSGRAHSLRTSDSQASSMASDLDTIERRLSVQLIGEDP